MTTRDMLNKEIGKRTFAINPTEMQNDTNK